MLISNIISPSIDPPFIDPSVSSEVELVKENSTAIGGSNSSDCYSDIKVMIKPNSELENNIYFHRRLSYGFSMNLRCHSS